MHRSVIALAVATLAVGGQAFIIPPNMNKDVINDAEFMLMNGVDPNNRVLKAECKGCLEDGKDGALIYDLVITGASKFLLNGADFTPMNLHTNQLDFLELLTPPPVLSVPLVPAESTLAELTTTDLKPKEAKVMYNYYSEIGTVGDAELYKLVLEPTSVGGRQISHDATAKIEVQILIVEDGKMVIFDAQTTEVEFKVPTLIEEDCGFICEMMDKLIGWGKKAEEKVGAWGKKIGTKFKPCGKNANGDVEIGSTEEPIITGGNTPEPKKDEKPEEDTFSILPIPPNPDRTPTSSWRRPPYSRPHHRPHHSEGDEGHRHPRPWSHHHHHHHHRPHHMSHTHGAASALYRIFVQVLVPIAIGIIAGMFVSLMGMVVGHFAVLAYQKAVGAVRRARCAPESEGAKDEEEVSKGLLSEEEYKDSPPEYDGEGREEVLQEKQ